MQKRYLFFLLLFCGCESANEKMPEEKNKISIPKTYNKIGEIHLPEGFVRTQAGQGSFTEWLRNVPLKQDTVVYLYNGKKKTNQSAQFGVIDIPTGTKDLQQCADVVMRLRAEYLFAQKRFNEIAFMDFNGKWYKWTGADNRNSFENYLATVFGWCGSASLEKQLKSVSDFKAIQPGDVLIKGGFPGHAMIVVDMAVNSKGEKIFLLAQGYQPAQDMHVVKNPMYLELSPWYSVSDQQEIHTPEWTFMQQDLKRW